MPIFDQVRTENPKQTRIRTRDLNFGETLRIMPLTRVMLANPFSYPAYKPDLENRDRMQDGFAIFNSTPAGKEMSPPEASMIKIWQTAIQNLTESVRKRAARHGRSVAGMSFNKVEVWFGDKRKTWGYNFPLQGIQVVEHGNICDLQLTDAQAKAVISARNRVVNDRLEYTPLLCWLVITIREGREFFNNATRNREKSRQLEIQIAGVGDDCKGILPPSFGGCVTVHPEDVSVVADWVADYHKSFFEGGEAGPEPVYRDYPDGNGDVYYVATSSVQTPIKLNVLERGLSPKLLELISNREEPWQYKPATELSLLGGYYYTTPAGNIPLTLNEIKSHYVRSENGQAVIRLHGQEHVVQWLAGSLWQKKFNPFLVDSQEKFVFEDSDPEALADLARKLGIPVKGDEDPVPITDWDAFMSGSSRPVRNAPVSNL